MTRINAFFIPPSDAPDNAAEGCALVEAAIAIVDSILEESRPTEAQQLTLASGEETLKQWSGPCGTLWFGWHIWACAAQGPSASDLRRRLLSLYQRLYSGDSYRAPVFDRTKIAKLLRLPDDSQESVLAAMADSRKCWMMAAWCKKKWESESKRVKALFMVGSEPADDDVPEAISALDRACLRKESYDYEGGI